MEVRNSDMQYLLLSKLQSDVIAREMAELYAQTDNLAFLTVLEHCLDH